MVLLVVSLSSRRAWIEIKSPIGEYLPYIVALLTESVDWNRIFRCSRGVKRRRSPHGERGLKLYQSKSTPPKSKCRSPHGERGLKSLLTCPIDDAIKSLSSRRAWIEITFFNPREFGRSGRSPHGERGLKYCMIFDRSIFWSCRSPHGERGLK